MDVDNVKDCKTWSSQTMPSKSVGDELTAFGYVKNLNQTKTDGENKLISQPFSKPDHHRQCPPLLQLPWDWVQQGLEQVSFIIVIWKKIYNQNFFICSLKENIQSIPFCPFFTKKWHCTICAVLRGETTNQPLRNLMGRLSSKKIGQSWKVDKTWTAIESTQILIRGIAILPCDFKQGQKYGKVKI